MLVSLVLAGLVAAPAAGAHVTVNPREWEAGGFARFAVRVPTERPDASTTRVTVQLPEGLFFVSFQPKPGWERTIEMEELDEPVELFGEPVEERVASVTWEGGEIRPGEFDEFGMSARIPETPGEDLVFPSLQEYDSGEVVRWIGPPDADEPAPVVAVLPPAEEEEDDAAAATEEEEEPEQPTQAAVEGDEAVAAPAVEGGEGRANLALGFGIAGLIAGLAALGFALFRRPGRP